MTRRRGALVRRSRHVAGGSSPTNPASIKPNGKIIHNGGLRETPDDTFELKWRFLATCVCVCRYMMHSGNLSRQKRLRSYFQRYRAPMLEVAAVYTNRRHHRNSVLLLCVLCRVCRYRLVGTCRLFSTNPLQRTSC